MKLQACILASCLSASAAFMPNSALNSITRSPFSLAAKKAAESADDKNTKEKAAKRAALEGVLQKIERSYGRGSIVKLGDADNMLIDCISSGALTLGKQFFVRLLVRIRFRFQSR